MKIIITEEQKKKLFTPRNLSNDSDNRYIQWNKEQPIRDGKPINQYDMDGKKQGYWEHYHENGQLWYIGSFIDDEPDGEWVEYYRNGRILGKGLFKNGREVEYFINESEQPKKKLFTPKNLSNDENNRFIQWNKEQPIRDGKPINQYDLDGRKQGYWETYYNSGKLSTKGNYINDKRNGDWESYYENGELLNKYFFKNGKSIEGLNEVIKASEAYNDMNSFKTLEDGKRGVAFIVIGMSEKNVKNYILNSIKKNDFGFIKVKEHPYGAMIIYRTGYRQDAEELYKIAKKYGGFLSGNATYEDSKRIGELLGYETDDINSYLNKNYVNGVLKEGKIYPYNLNQGESDVDYILYEFKNKDGFDFEVQFYKYYGDVWEREYKTIQKGMGVLNTNDIYNIIETVTNITIDFIKKYEPEKIKIAHIRQNKESIFIDPDKPSKRALLNQRYLKPAIDKLPNYVYILNGNSSIISKI